MSLRQSALLGIVCMQNMVVVTPEKVHNDLSFCLYYYHLSNKCSCLCFYVPVNLSVNFSTLHQFVFYLMVKENARL